MAGSQISTSSIVRRGVQMSLWKNVQFSLRSMRKSPRIALTVLATLTLGIGANTAIFSVVNATLLKPLPFHNPGELVELNADLRGLGAHNVGFSVPELDDLRDRAGIFTAVSVVWPTTVNLTGGDRPDRLDVLAVSPNYFSILGAQPELGRLFDARDTADGFAEAVVISDSLWHKEFGGDPSAVGRSVRLDNDLYTIVGVLPPQFHHPSIPGLHPVDMWLTAGYRAEPFPAPRRSLRFLPGIIARLKPGITLQQAQAQLEVLSDSLRRDYGSDYPTTAGWALSIAPLREVVAGSARTLLTSPLLAVGLILLIACVNVANLLLVNGTARQREMALRLALGATRGRIIRQMLTESALLSLVSAVGGAAAAAIGVRALVSFLPSQLPRLNPIGVDASVLAFSLIVALVATMLFGLIPALQASRTQPGTAELRERGGSASRRATTLGKTLVGAEVALSLMLLVAAGLLLRTFWNLLRVNPGFNSHHLLAGSFRLPVPNDPKADEYVDIDQRTHLVRESIRRLHGIAGVENAAMSSVVPLNGPVIPGGFRVEGVPDKGDAPTAVEVSVTPEFFSTMGTPLLRGRMFQESDDSMSQPVALVDEAAARLLWGGVDPVGRRVRSSRDIILSRLKPVPAPWITVVGVVGNAKLSSLDEIEVPHIYESMYQRSKRDFGVLVRAIGDKAALTRNVRREIQTVDPDLPVSDMTAMTDLISNGVGDRRFAAWLLGAFALVALLLTCVGVYGIASYSVVRREKEIGIRSALGASRQQLVIMILRDGMVPVLVGMACGCIAAVFSGRMLAALLFGVNSEDGLVLACAGITLVVIGMLANYIPARGAGRIDPITALRNE
ncbi:MAG TPA: ABC transporter permease [Candidatus Acidoferrales bacterium]|nr:ABC transporter permease [Candidatus Acidoferrales bacterium]